MAARKGMLVRSMAMEKFMDSARSGAMTTYLISEMPRNVAREIVAKNVSLIGQVAESMEEGKTSLIALVSEKDELSFDVNFTKFDAHITRLDAAEVAAEVEKAMEVQRSLQKEAREKMREDKKEARRARVEQQRARLEAEFEEFKQNFRRKDKE